MDKVAPYYKAVVAILLPGLAVLAGFLIGDIGFGDLNAGQWVAIVIAVLGTPIGVYSVPNRG